MLHDLVPQGLPPVARPVLSKARPASARSLKSAPSKASASSGNAALPYDMGGLEGLQAQLNTTQATLLNEQRQRCFLQLERVWPLLFSTLFYTPCTGLYVLPYLLLTTLLNSSKCIFGALAWCDELIAFSYRALLSVSLKCRNIWKLCGG